MSPEFFFPSILKPRYKRDGSIPADMVVLSARVVTCNDANPRAEALAVRDGRFVYVGGNDGAADFIGPDTKVINARRRTVTPGFIDNHAHVLWMSALLPLMTTELYNCNSMEDIRSVMLEYAGETPGLPLVMGLGFRYDYIPGGLPDRTMLDEMIIDRPCVLWSYGGQSGWLNTAAVELFRERNDAALKRLGPDVDDSGRYTGLLRHFHAFNPLDYLTPEEMGGDIKEKMMEGMRQTMDEAISVGVTAMNDVQIYRPFVPMILEFRERGGLGRARVRCSYYIDPHDLEDEGRFKEELEWWKGVGKKESGPHLVMGDSLKFYIDGVSGNYTAFMLEPYPDSPDTHGDPVWTQEGFDRAIELIDGMGLQACTHCCGDAGIRRVINSYERARQINGQRDARHRCEHCDMPRLDDIDRMAKNGICVANQPAHFFAMDESVERIMGDRIDKIDPWKSLEDAGVLLSFGSDWCNSPLNPVYGLMLSATRMNYRGDFDWGPEERIDLEDSIKHWTMGSAKALHMEQDIGSIEQGKLADFVMFNQDPLKLSSWSFLLTHRLEVGALDDFVDMTVVDGRVAYEKGTGERPAQSASWGKE